MKYVQLKYIIKPTQILPELLIYAVFSQVLSTLLLMQTLDPADIYRQSDIVTLYKQTR